MTCNADYGLTAIDNSSTEVKNKLLVLIYGCPKAAESKAEKTALPQPAADVLMRLSGTL